ncbi:hypothetical protein M0R19_05500 [Candidatus Pacearchaeota archaeon]|jgi:hypothetical protein|nr:hypothetical protein [Candidatus Pacearchaeota archaeon]
MKKVAYFLLVIINLIFLSYVFLFATSCVPNQQQSPSKNEVLSDYERSKRDGYKEAQEKDNNIGPFMAGYWYRDLTGFGIMEDDW